MGIKDLSRWLSKYKTTITITQLSGLRIAIDVSTILYRVVKGSVNWTDRFINIITTLRSQRIKMVFVFDGKETPPEKDAERQHRRERDAKIRADYEWLCTVTIHTPGVYEELKRRFPKPKIKIPEEKIGLMEWIRRKILSMSVSTKSIDDEIIATTKQILDLLGLCWVEAFGEADPLCVELCCSGKVDAVITSDSDFLTYIGTSGCNLLVIYDLDCVAGTATFVSKPQLLEECGLTEEQFREFCILLGCDYNTKYRMYGYGPVNAYKKIVLYKTIEELVVGEEIDEEVIGPTNYVRCRELFTTSPCTVKIGANLEVQVKALEEYLVLTNSELTVEGILEAWTSVCDGTASVDEETEGEYCASDAHS
jgi:flap endonuclease-1